MALPVGLAIRGEVTVPLPGFYVRLGQALHALQDSFTHSYRTADALTAYGVMFFDTADLQALADEGLLDEVVAHEMGHVLGFGTLWNIGRSLLQGSGTADPRFIGPLAISAYDKLGGSGTVPVEGDFGPGTRDNHWDEATFDNELMTGFINSGSNPLSILTVRSLEDLGYAVNPAGADPFTFTVSASASIASWILNSRR